MKKSSKNSIAWLASLVILVYAASVDENTISLIVNVIWIVALYIYAKFYMGK